MAQQNSPIVLISNSLRLNRLAYENQVWKWRKKYCLLLSDGSLFYYEEKPTVPSFTGLAGSVLPITIEKPRAVIPVNECTLEKVSKFVFKLKDKATFEDYSFECSSKKLMIDWMKHLKIFTDGGTPTVRHQRKNSNHLLVMGYCSWCLEEVYQGKVSSGIISRDVYSCTYCCKPYVMKFNFFFFCNLLFVIINILKYTLVLYLVVLLIVKLL